MASARPLHELLADLAGDADAAHGDPETYLAAHGHPDLPADLVAEAVVSYADTAPVEVAEHLAPYVTTHSAVPADEPPADDWFGLLTTAPAEDVEPDIDDVPYDDSPPDHPGPALDFGTGSAGSFDEPSTEDTLDTADAADDSPDDADPVTGDHQQDPAWSDLDVENADLDALDADPDDDSDDSD